LADIELSARFESVMPGFDPKATRAAWNCRAAALRSWPKLELVRPWPRH